MTSSFKRGPHDRPKPSTKDVGDEAEARALAHLSEHGLVLLTRNFKTPGRGGGEIDLIMREPDGTVVFVEVRRRSLTRFGGGAASVGVAKQRRIVFAAKHYLLQWREWPPCRFDVVVLDGPDQALQWLVGAFEAG